MESRWPTTTKGSVLFLVTFLIVFIISPLAFFSHKAQQAQADNKAIVGSQGVAQITTPTKAPAREVTPADFPEQDAIDDYIRTIFGKDAKVFTAITRVECNPKNKQYPACVYHTEHEYSVGVAQINLFNKSHAIHANKVPGKTMEEKIESLKDPYINVLVAYKIFTDSGFAPWAGYTSGRYLDHMGE